MSKHLATDLIDFPVSTSTDASFNTLAGTPLFVFLFLCLGILKKHDSLNVTRRVARNSQWGGAVLGVWGRSPQLPEANGGLGAKPPASGGWGVKGLGFGGKAPSRRRHGGVGAEPPALENFAFFLQK